MSSLLQDPKIRHKVESLLTKMTLAQKIGQMTQAESSTCSPQQLRKHHLGAILSGAGTSPGGNQPSDWVKANDTYWQAAMDEDHQHLAIPILYGLDAIHGNNNVRGATVFPHNIGLGAANNVDLIQRVGQITATELLATGLDRAFAPNLAVAKDPRWGRTYESYSEDPALVSRYADAAVRGLQQDLNEDSVVACIKHWVGDGGTEHGIDHGNTNLSPQKLNKIHVAPFEAGLKAGALSVMTSFSSWNGDKCHGHSYLIQQWLKKKLGFNGMVVSDWNGIDYLTHDFYLSVGKGVNAGIDMFMLPDNWQQFIEHLHSHVELGTVSIDRINDAVRRILSVKFAYGLFDKPRPADRKWSNHPSFGSQEHRAVAREAVRKSLVLLKNQDNILPLSKQARILVAGKNADNTGYQCGGFTIGWQGMSGKDAIAGGTSIWQGIQQLAPHAELSEDGSGQQASPERHDLAIVVIGEYPYAEGQGDIRDGDNLIVETGSQIKGQVKILECYGESLALSELHPEDIQVIKTIRSKDVPVVAILISGRPLLINQELAASQAFIAAWLPGSEGQGVSDVLFGDWDFHGKLSFSWPKQVPSKTPGSAKKPPPLFPLGYGLSYQAQPATKPTKRKSIFRYQW